MSVALSLYISNYKIKKKIDKLGFVSHIYKIVARFPCLFNKSKNVMIINVINDN